MVKCVHLKTQCLCSHWSKVDACDHIIHGGVLCLPATCHVFMASRHQHHVEIFLNVLTRTEILKKHIVAFPCLCKKKARRSSSLTEKKNENEVGASTINKQMTNNKTELLSSHHSHTWKSSYWHYILAEYNGLLIF